MKYFEKKNLLVVLFFPHADFQKEIGTQGRGKGLFIQKISM